MQGRCFDLTTFQSEGEDVVAWEAPDDSGVIEEETGDAKMMIMMMNHINYHPSSHKMRRTYNIHKLV